MQLHRRSLGVGDLVPSQPALPFWPSAAFGGGSCGMGDLVNSQPGLPFWPSGSGMGDLVDSAPDLPFWPSSQGMGDTVPTAAMYPIAQNSVLAYYGLSGLGLIPVNPRFPVDPVTLPPVHARRGHAYAYGRGHGTGRPAGVVPGMSGLGDCGCGCGGSGKCGGGLA